nr:hypothetical protein [uncultured Flavobacterium sp.]
MSDFLKEFGENLKTNMPGFIAVAIAEIKSGISYYSLSTVDSFDPELASAFNLEVVKSKMNVIASLGLKEKIDDIIFTLSSQIHIVDVSENGEYLIYLAVDSTKGNIGMTKAMLNRYKKDIESKI